MTCFIRRLRIYRGSLVSDATRLPSHSPGGVLQSPALHQKLHHHARRWNLEKDTGTRLVTAGGDSLYKAETVCVVDRIPEEVLIYFKIL